MQIEKNNKNMPKVLTFRDRDRAQWAKQGHTSVKTLVPILRTRKIVHVCICTSDSMVRWEVERKESPETHEPASLKYTAKHRETLPQTKQKATPMPEFVF